MGQPKALLDAGEGESFLSRAIRVLREAGVVRCAAVVPDGPVGRHLADHATGLTAEVLPNPDHGKGMTSSLRVAARAALDHPGPGGLLILPVDLPLITAATVRRVVDAGRARPGVIVRPRHRDVDGHPVYFPMDVVPELVALTDASGGDGPGGRGVIQRDPSRVRVLEVDDPGVVADVDTPEEYRRIFGREPVLAGDPPPASQTAS